MQIFRGILIVAAIASIAALGGCSSALIDKRIGAELVGVEEASQVANCQSKGKVTINVLSKLGFVNRSVEAVDANLLQMARNSAVDAGGDTLVKGERADVGIQTFSIYKCH
ncbi:MAG: DUF4156 domain-containing protein [Burkholderiaceae bacterium]